jgi:hypothetical protein
VGDETGIGDEYHLKLNNEGDAQKPPDAIKKTGLNADFVRPL